MRSVMLYRLILTKRFAARPTCPTRTVSATTQDLSQELLERRDQIRTFIERHFGSQRAFCQATSLKPARVSKALQDRYISNRRLLPLEHAIERWKKQNGATTEKTEVTVPVYVLKNGRLRPLGEREPVGQRGVPHSVDRERLVYVEVTFSHHTVVELVEPDGVGLDALRGTAQQETLDFASLSNGQWAYVTVRFDAEGRPDIPGGAPDDLTIFGRAVMRLDIGQ